MQRGSEKERNKQVRAPIRRGAVSAVAAIALATMPLTAHAVDAPDGLASGAPEAPVASTDEAVNTPETATAPEGDEGTASAAETGAAPAGTDADVPEASNEAGAEATRSDEKAEEPAVAEGANTADTAQPAPAEMRAPAEGTTASGQPLTPITEIQKTGQGDDSALSGKKVSARGIVTAVYTHGEDGLNTTLSGFTIQTPGTGGAWDPNRAASDALFVYVGSKFTMPAPNQCVDVTGTVGEYPKTDKKTPAETLSLTQLSPTEISTVKDCEPVAPTPLSEVPTAAQMEALESMLVKPEGAWTITDNYTANTYGTLMLTPGTEPLRAATDVVAPGEEAKAYEAANAAKQIALDDGTNTYLAPRDKNTATDVPFAYLANGAPARVGYRVDFTKPVILDSRNKAFVFQPTSMVAAHPDRSPATITGERPSAPSVAGDIRVATFNVLNYFSDLGEDEPGCKGYADRLGNLLTAKNCKVRGAHSKDAFLNQQAKIVLAINALNADVVALEEIENSQAVLGKDRDEALKNLVSALNQAAGDDVWTHVPSPKTVPADEDVIRIAYIYKPATVKTVGESEILDDAAFTKLARQPLAQRFAPVEKEGMKGTEFVLIANHFKSKGSVPKGMEEGNTDNGDGQGNANAVRVAQATALAKFAEKFADTPTLLVGDFNSYSQEDPLKVLTSAGWTRESGSTDASYVYGGRSGSLDHVFANAAAHPLIAEVGSWALNAQEAVAFEYSRANYNAHLLFEKDNPFRSSDHNPEIVGLKVYEDAPLPPAGPVTLDLYNLTDVHGHIEQVKKKEKIVEAGLPAMKCYLEDARGKNPNSSLTLLGDNIGASPYTSGSLKDNPTIAALNTLKPLASTIGNHELDMGQAVFKQRVDGSNPSEYVQVGFPYLGANVEGMGTWGAEKHPYLGEYKVWESPSGVKVAFIGAIAEDVPYKLAPGTTEGLVFTDPIAKIDALAAKIKESGEAQIVVAMLDDDVKNNYPKVGANVDAIMGGDTHVPYEFDKVDSAEKLDSKNPLLAGIASGSYTDNLGLVRISYDPVEKKVLSADSILIPAAKVAECGEAEDTKAVVDKAVADSKEAGKRVVGTGYTETFKRGVFTAPGDKTDPGSNRGVESSLGDLVADAMRETITTTDGKPVDFGIINAGGLRADLVPNEDGTITYAQSYAVMPFSNELGYVTLSGAQVKQMLEEQWKTNLNSQNSRPMLKLGISENVRYTYDPSAEFGKRITSVTIDGAPLDPERNYTIGSVTFLLAGGDSFDALKANGPAVNTGHLDRDKFNEYLGKHSGLKPRALKSSIGVTLPSEPVKDGATVKVELRGLSFTEGPSVTQKVKARLGGEFSEAEVDNSLLEEHASDEASVITTDGAGRAVVEVVAKGVCTSGEPGEIVDAPLIVETDFGRVIDETAGLSAKVICEGKPAGPTASVDRPEAAQGESIEILGEGFVPGHWVRAELHSDPIVIGKVKADEKGVARFTHRLSASTPAGDHTIVLVDEDNGAVAKTALKVLAKTDAGTTQPGGGDPGVANTAATKPATASADSKGSSLAKTGLVGGTLLLAVPLLLVSGLVLRSRKSA